MILYFYCFAYPVTVAKLLSNYSSVNNIGDRRGSRMEKVKKLNDNQEILTFKTQDGVTVTMYGKPNFEIWAKKMLELYNQKVSTSAS